MMGTEHGIGDKKVNTVNKHGNVPHGDCINKSGVEGSRAQEHLTSCRGSRRPPKVSDI